MSIASKCTCGASLAYCNGSPQCKRGNMLLECTAALDKGAERIEELEQMLRWRNVADERPPLDVKVIRADGRVEGHPEWDNQCIDSLYADCLTGIIKWRLDGREPHNEFWYPLQDPPPYTKR